MKNILLIFIGLITFYGCSNKKEEIEKKSSVNDFQKIVDNKSASNRLVQIITIDSCEYIVWDGSHGEVGFAHKGNCKWCYIRQISK